MECKYGGYDMSFFKEFKEDLSLAVNELYNQRNRFELESAVEDFEQEVAPISGVESGLEKIRWHFTVLC